MKAITRLGFLLINFSALGCSSDSSDPAPASPDQSAEETIAGKQPLSGQSAQWRRTKADDTTAPPTPGVFTVKPGPWLGQTTLTIAYPEMTGDYTKIEFHRNHGVTAPTKCDSATLVQTTTDFAAKAPVVDSGMYPGDSYSYIACIFDSSDNVTIAQADGSVRAGTSQRLFVTSVSTFDGNLAATYEGQTFTSGAEGADFRCQSLAEGAGLSGSFKAIIGTMADRIPLYHSDIYGEVYNNAKVPELVAHTRSDLFRGGLRAAVKYDESGTAVATTYDGNEDISDGFVFSGISTYGSTMQAYTCNNWTSASSSIYKVAGDPTSLGEKWVWSIAKTCDQGGHLYCLESFDKSGIDLPTLSVESGDNSDEFNVTIAFPEDLTKIQSVRIIRRPGKFHLDDTCRSYWPYANTAKYFDGSTAYPFTAGTYVDDVNDYGWYSYALCAYDTFGNLYSRVVTSSLEAGTSANYKRAFVTAATFDGNLGGVAGANTKCSTAASNAGLAGTWKAIIADGGNSVYNNISISAATFDFDGNYIANSTYGLFSYDLTTKLFISTDENGTAIAEAAKVWTGSTSSGYASGNSCSNWSSNSAASTGTYGIKTEAWSLERISDSTATCDTVAHLYCVQQ
jgi:hypothetical protein